MSNSVPLPGEADKEIGANFAPLSVTAQDIPNLTVKIRAGSFWNDDSVVVQYPGGNSPSIPAPGSLFRWTVLSLTPAGSLLMTHGTAAAAPSIPAPPAGVLPLAAIYMGSTTTQITNAMIQDVRPLFDVVDTVPNLAAELANRPTFTDVANDLALKADVDGTPNSEFSLSKGAVGPANASLVVDRGPSAAVSIRWNNATGKWQFTNDGSTFVDIASVSGVFMNLVAAPVAGDLLTTDGAGQAVDSGTNLAGLATVAALAAKVSKAGDTMTGLLILSANPVVALGAATKQYVDTGLALKADDALVVHLAGIETITGAKTFTAAPTFSAVGNSFINFTKGAASDAGIHVDRGVDPYALIEWDETTDQWLAGVNGAAFPILTAENLALDDLTDVVLTAPATNNVLQYNGTDWVNTAKVTLAAGTAAAPAYTFASDATKGMYDSGAGEISFAIAGAQKVRIDAGGITTFSGYAVGGVPGMALWAIGAPTTGVSFATPGQVTLTVLGVPVATFGGAPGPTTALTNAAIGTTVQAWDADLDAVAAIGAGSGFVRRNAGVWSVAALTGAEVNTALGYTAASAARNINTTAGDLTGGGNLSVDLTLSLATTAVTPGSYGSASAVGTFTVDSKGRLTAAVDAPIAIAGSAVTVAGFTLGHVVSLDAAGHPVDSGIAAADVFLRTGTVAMTGTLNLNDQTVSNAALINGSSTATLTITAGTSPGAGGNALFLRGGAAVNGSGGDVQLIGRDGAGANENGGGVFVTTGSPTGAGTAGQFGVFTPAGQSIRASGLGNVALGLDTDPIAANNGFPYIPFTTSAGTPTGIPTSIPGFAPMIAQDDAGTYLLWIYMSGAWRSVALT